MINCKGVGGVCSKVNALERQKQGCRWAQAHHAIAWDWDAVQTRTGWSMLLHSTLNPACMALTTVIRIMTQASQGCIVLESHAEGRILDIHGCSIPQIQSCHLVGELEKLVLQAKTRRAIMHHWRAKAGDRRELRLKGHILLELLGRGKPKCQQTD